MMRFSSLLREPTSSSGLSSGSLFSSLDFTIDQHQNRLRRALTLACAFSSFFSNMYGGFALTSVSFQACAIVCPSSDARTKGRQLGSAARARHRRTPPKNDTPEPKGGVIVFSVVFYFFVFAILFVCPLWRHSTLSPLGNSRRLRQTRAPRTLGRLSSRSRAEA